MGSSVQVGVRDNFAGTLIEMLHDDAPAEDFGRCLGEVEGLPAGRGKSRLLGLVRTAMRVRRRMDLYQQRERGMSGVIESAQEVSSRLELGGLLAAIVSRARRLLGADVAWLSTYDAQRGEYHVMATDGAFVQATSSMVAARNQGAGSILMSTQLPFITTDYLQDDRFPHDPVLDDTFRAEGIAALVGVPLISAGSVVGLLFVADRYHRTHSAQSVALLSALATQGAIALKNAHDFSTAQAALDEAEQARAQLERHVRSVQAAAEAHERMTSLLARGASLSTLCETIAGLLGGGVLVLDEAGQVLSRGAAPGYRGSGLQDHATQSNRRAEFAQALGASRRMGRSVLAWEADGESCRVIAVIGGDDVLGSAVLYLQGELDPIAIRTFERSSSVIGIVLLSQERMEATKNRDASTLLRTLISPRQDEPALMANHAERHGLDLTRSLSLLLIETDGPSAGHAARRLGAPGSIADALVDEVDGLLLVVCATGQADAVRQTISQRARVEWGAAHRGVLSRPVIGPAGIPALYATLRRALGVLPRIGVTHQIVGQDELALYSTLFETQDPSSLDAFLGATIGVLVAHDQKRGSSLTSTLLTFFEANQNAKLTAQRLRIHVNTVRQRLATIGDLMGEWSQASRALEIHVALRLWRLRLPPA